MLRTRMSSCRWLRNRALVALLIAPATIPTVIAQSQRLTIVVIAGEGAVNIIQQKTAVAPVVEVRDRNDQPVAGAVVRFDIKGGRASFNGARTLSVTTNAAGRAAVTGLTPSSSGAFQIGASAAFQGQTAAVSIAQINVMTAAQAAQIASVSGAGVSSGAAAGAAVASGAAAAGGAAAGGAAAAGGGLSAITIGSIVGGAVAGGTLAARQVGLLGGGGIGGVYEGPFRMAIVQTIQDFRGDGTISLSCNITIDLNGELRLVLEELAGETVAGRLGNKYGGMETARTCTVGQIQLSPVTFTDGFDEGAVTGTTGLIEWNVHTVNAFGTAVRSFSGPLIDGKITGTLTMSDTSRSVQNTNGSYRETTVRATSTSVTLDK